MTVQVDTSAIVLIETLWNVKKEEKSTEQKFAERINRNIVECKVHQNNFVDDDWD